MPARLSSGLLVLGLSPTRRTASDPNQGDGVRFHRYRDAVCAAPAEQGLAALGQPDVLEELLRVVDTLGGRDIAMPYCTLCGSAQVYFTDEVPEGIERPILRTSGLLTRSNKVMYDDGDVEHGLLLLSGGGLAGFSGLRIRSQDQPS